MEHVCKEIDYCICSSQALEPDDNCPIHGAGEWPPRCMYCGRFMKWPELPPEEPCGHMWVSSMHDRCKFTCANCGEVKTITKNDITTPDNCMQLRPWTKINGMKPVFGLCPAIEFANILEFEYEHYRLMIEELRKYFTSANEIEVDRAVIRRDDWLKITEWSEERNDKVYKRIEEKRKRNRDE